MKNNVLARARPGASQVIIVLTDGVSQDEVERAASDLIGQKAFIFAVGIGPQIDATELTKIAALPENVYQTADYNALSQITDTLYGKLCSSVKSDTCSAGKQDIAFIVDRFLSLEIYLCLKSGLKSKI